MDWNVWGPPLMVLVLGAAAGVVLGLRARGASAVTDPREVLNARKAQLLEELKILEMERGKHDPEDYASRKDALVNEAADVLRAIDAPIAVEPASKPVPAGGVRALWAVGSAAFIGVAALVLVKSTAPRADGDTMTGNVSDGAAAAPPPNARVDAALAALESNPDDIDALNVVAHYAIMNRQVEVAMEYVDKARKLDADHPEVQTHLAAMQFMVGMHDRLDETLDVVLTEHPVFTEAMIWKGISLLNRGRVDEAKPVLQKVLEVGTNQEDRQAASAILADIARFEASGGAQASGGASGGTSGGAQASAPAGEPRVSGQLTLGDGAGDLPAPLLFIYVRKSPEERGPPLAAVRLESPSFPLDFKLSEANLIRGGDWPAEVWIKARVPAGGDPMVRSPEDWESEMIGPVSIGTDDLALSLSPPS